MVDDGGTDWAGCYAWSAGRAPRPLLLAACQELGAGQDRLAIDLGCGEGTDALPYLCLGAHLARREMTVTLRELLTPVPGMVAGEPGRLLSSFINGIKP